jgi:hypothetical protein
MSGSGVLLDSVILIDHLNGIPAAAEYLKVAGRKAHISPITRAEVLTDLEGEARRIAAQFLDCFTFLPINLDVADLAAELRHIHRSRLPDAFQAAVAQFNGLDLATRNTDDFNPQRHSVVVVPYILKKESHNDGNTDNAPRPAVQPCRRDPAGDRRCHRP